MGENKYVNLIRPRHTLILTPELQSNYNTDTSIKGGGGGGAGIRRRRQHAVLKTKNSLNTDAVDSGYYSLNEKRMMGEV